MNLQTIEQFLQALTPVPWMTSFPCIGESLAQWTAALPVEEGAWLLGDKQKWAASFQAG